MRRFVPPGPGMCGGGYATADAEDHAEPCVCSCVLAWKEIGGAMSLHRVTAAAAWAIALGGCAGETPATEPAPRAIEVIELVPPPVYAAPEEPAASPQPESTTIRVVADVDGRPIPGARVRLLPPLIHSEFVPPFAPFDRPVRKSEDVVVTDATGTVVVDRDAYEGSDCVVEADGYVAAEPGDRRGDRIGGISVRLRPGAVVEGRVVDAATGEAVAGARVTSRKYFEIYDGGRRLECGSATSDRDGRFRIPTHDPGPPF